MHTSSTPRRRSSSWAIPGTARSIIYSIIALPLLITVAFSLYINQSAATASGVPSDLSLGLDSITYFFVVLAAVLPTSIAAYSIVGEKVEKSLEPLLATPATDGEILLGKSIAAFVPPILATWGGASIFMADTDFATHNLISYYYFPNWNSRSDAASPRLLPQYPALKQQ